MKYGIMYYKRTDNIGDDIQTYTATKFLPHIDYYIDREDLNCFIPENKEIVSMIMNGWFMHNKAAWPPSPYINPLLISMHFTCLEKIDVGEKYLQGFGGEYLKKHQPIGSRDVETQKRLNRNGIENYFSGCMTLTINPFEDIEKKNYICLVDLDPKSTNLVKENTNREIVEITHDVNPEEIEMESFEKRMQNVEELLKTYQAAHLVLTNRLHVALPCIAIGTPVILVHKEKFETDRLGTYLQYVNSYSDLEFEQLDIKELIENPKENSKEYLNIRNFLVEKCEEFINKCENRDEFDTTDLPKLDEYKEYIEKIKWYQQLHEEVRVKAKKNIYEAEEKYKNYEQEITRINKINQELKKELDCNYNKLEEENQKLQEKCNKIKEELDLVYNSKGWQYLEKLRKIKNKMKK